MVSAILRWLVKSASASESEVGTANEVETENEGDSTVIVNEEWLTGA
jgi:hypothetical protein